MSRRCCEQTADGDDEMNRKPKTADGDGEADDDYDDDDGSVRLC